jgi:hypothetical protein
MADSKRKDGLWVLKPYTVKDNVTQLAGVTFILNPTKVTITPKQRATVTETLGGTAYVPWQETGLYAGYSRFDLGLSGLGRVYLRSNPNSAKEGPNSGTMVGRLFADYEIKRNEAKGMPKETKSSVDRLEENKRYKSGLLELYRATMSPLVKNGFITRWQLEWLTPVFSGVVDETDLKNKIVVTGLITTPMVINEDAGNPWLSSWSFTFSVFDGEVLTLMNKIDSFISNLQLQPKG